MDQNEYRERFRLAVLWDEFERRKFPQIDLGPAWSDQSRLRQFYKNPKAFQRRFDWERIQIDAANIYYLIGAAFYDGVLGASAITSLWLATWRLRQCLVRIRNPDLRDYYEHLVYVAEQVLVELDREESSRSDAEIHD